MSAFDRRYGDDEEPNFIVIRGPGAGVWEGVWFNLSEMGWGEPGEMGGRYEPTGDVEFRADGTVAQVYRCARPAAQAAADVAVTEHHG